MRRVLDKAEVAFASIRDLENEVQLLIPKLENSDDKVKALRENIENHRQRYINVSITLLFLATNSLEATCT